MKRESKVIIIVISVFLGLAAWTVWQEYNRAEIQLLEGGKAQFHRHGILSSQALKLSMIHNHWCFDGGSEFAVPFECRFNDYYMLRFENGGRVYLMDKQSYTREELRVIEGEWSRNIDGEWVSIFDYIEP